MYLIEVTLNFMNLIYLDVVGGITNDLGTLDIRLVDGELFGGQATVPTSRNPIPSGSIAHSQPWIIGVPQAVYRRARKQFSSCSFCKFDSQD